MNGHLNITRKPRNLMLTSKRGSRETMWVFIDRSVMERLSKLKILGINILDDSHGPAFRCYHERRCSSTYIFLEILKDSVCSNVLTNFCRCTIDWLHQSTAIQTRCSKVVDLAQSIMGTAMLIESIHEACLERVAAITNDAHHSDNAFFSQCSLHRTYKSPRCHTWLPDLCITIIEHRQQKHPLG